MKKLHNPDLLRKRVGRCGILLLLYVIIFGLMFIILKPFVYKILMAFMHPDDLLDSTVRLVPRIFSTYYWQTALEGMRLDEAGPNTVFLSLAVAVIQVAVCVWVGYGLARFKFKGKNIAFAFVIIIMLVPFSVTRIAQYLQFVYFGIGGFQVDLTDTFWPILILAATGLGLKEGLYIYMFREFFQSLPDSLEEAAYIDGAGVIRTLFRVMLPNARTIILTVFIFSFCWQYTDTAYSSLFFYEKPVFANVINAIYIRVGLNADILGTFITRNAAAMLIMIPLIILFGFCQRFFLKSVTLSGLAN